MQLSGMDRAMLIAVGWNNDHVLTYVNKLSIAEISNIHVSELEKGESFCYNEKQVKV